ncbi:high-affinity methionine permease [Phlyctema vagabunda]|uniref:High-affinity methionine permease n=1 Tax=Phlyctema vagabunda TaxID=108571 RepID=A0ABR4PV28_9HELO
MAVDRLWRKVAGESAAVAIHHDGSDSNTSVLRDGDLEYTREVGGNGSKPSYQEASGAPVEKSSPLGYQIQWFTVIFLNIGQMVGTGVFSTPFNGILAGSIYRGVGSVGLSLIYWFIGLLIAGSGLAVYLELAAYFPNRSGAEVVYLEQAYPRPRYFFPTTFAVLNVLLAFSSSNAIVLSSYLFRIGEHDPSEWESKGVAIAGYTVAVIFCIISNKYSLYLSNGIGVLKVLTLIFISLTGLVVLGGNVDRVPDPKANFRNAFEGTSNNAYGLTNAIVRINFAYEGYANSFNMVNEVKNPIRTMKIAGPASLIAIAVLYMFVNIAYFAAVPKDEIRDSQTIAASLFFEHVFGGGGAARGLNVLIVLSAFGNLISNLIGASRVIRECGRQGVLPWPKFWASTQPFGTPLGPYLLKYVLTLLMIIAPPFGDAFNFVVDLKSYPDAVFYLFMASGVYLIRRRRKRINAEKAEFKAWHVPVIFWILVQVFLLVMPWYPPLTGRYGGNVSFWYATYCVTGIAILAACGIYYWVWIYVLPKLRGYKIRQEVLVLDNGATTHKLVNVPNSELAVWDSEHDVTGKYLRTDVTQELPDKVGQQQVLNY